MTKIPTAMDCLDKRFPDVESLNDGNIWIVLEEMMIEFAKMHVEAALKEASESISSLSTYEETVRDVLNSYSLSNIV